MTTPLLTREQKYEELVAAIVKAVPDVAIWRELLIRKDRKGAWQDTCITLEDVLRTFGLKQMYPEISFGLNQKMVFKIWETIDRKNPTMIGEWHLGYSLD